MKRLLALMLAACLVLAAVPAAAPAVSWPLSAGSFRQAAVGGFGSDQNAYAWSMAEFKGDVYVGTARTGNLNTIMPMISGILGFQMPSLPGPPSVLDWIDATATAGPTVKDPAKFEEWNSLAHAEIWRYHDGAWSKVYTAKDIPSFLLAKDGTRPYMTAEVTGLRSMSVFTDKNGEQALYATSGGATFGMPGVAPKILKSTDGVTWQPLQTPPGMGRETRATAVHEGKLYAGASTANSGYEALGTGFASIWSSDNAADPSSWKKVLDFAGSNDTSNSSIASIASFNGHVYVGTESLKGFQVWRSKVATPTGNDDWVKVMDNGGGDRYNFWAATMKVFKNKLYVGSIAVPGLPGRTGIKGFDLFSIDTADDVRIIAGNRRPAMPVTEGELREYPLSGLPSGFGNPVNMYCWSMEVYNGRLYLGTLDQTGMFLQMLNMPGIPSWLKSLPLGRVNGGADLWQTGDGKMWTPVFLNGLGDSTNYGIRTMKVTNSGKLFLGTANPFKGCQVWFAP